MDQHSLQDMIDEGPGQRENLRQFIDKLVHEGYTVGDAEGPDPMLVDPGGRAVETWREDYPYDTLLTRDEYEAEKYKLQVELLKLQYWSQDHDVRHIILFEGRDAAGKGGTIKRFTEHLNPRAARVVALTKPTTTELGQWYFQRYIEHFPTFGEIVLFDRSWYNRAGVERVMGFCTDEQYEIFMGQAPEFERMIVDAGPDVADDWIAEHVAPGDVAITNDIPLAERVLQAGAHAVTPSGKPFTENSIGAAIAQRALMEQLRSTGDIMGGPKPFDRNDRSRYLQALDEIIQKERRKRALQRG